MKIFIFTYDRYTTLTTPMYFDRCGIEHTVLCHSAEDKEKFIRAGRVNPRKILATLNPKGLAFNRNYALSQMREGEWALFMVDDLKNMLEYEHYDSEEREQLPITIKNTKEYTPLFKKKINAVKFLERCEESIAKAEKEGVELVGFAGFTNPLFLSKKWKYNALADGRCWLVKKGKLRFDLNTQLVDDISWSVLNIKHKGLIINQWVIPDCKRYTKGGYGSKVQRIRQRIRECEYLVDKHPDELYFAKKAGWPEHSHIRIRNNIRK